MKNSISMVRKTINPVEGLKPICSRMVRRARRVEVRKTINPVEGLKHELIEALEQLEIDVRKTINPVEGLKAVTAKNGGLFIWQQRRNSLQELPRFADPVRWMHRKIERIVRILYEFPARWANFPIF